MKAYVLNDKSIKPWPFGDAPLPAGSEGRLIDIIIDPVPSLTATQIAVPGPITTDFDEQGNPTQQHQTWTVREIDPNALARAAEINNLISQGKAALAAWPPNAATQLAILKGLVQFAVHILEENRLDLNLPK